VGIDEAWPSFLAEVSGDATFGVGLRAS